MNRLKDIISAQKVHMVIRKQKQNVCIFFFIRKNINFLSEIFLLTVLSPKVDVTERSLEEIETGSGVSRR